MPENNPFDFPGINVKWGQAAGGGLAGTYPNPTVSSISGLTAGGYLSGTYPNPTVNKVKGTVTNDNATAGDVGEYINSEIVIASAIALTSAVSANVTSISLTAGDWDVTGQIAFTGNTGTLSSINGVAFNTTSATIPAAVTYMFYNNITNTSSTPVGFAMIPTRFSLSGTTTVYLVCQATFTVACKAFGHIDARRVR